MAFKNEDIAIHLSETFEQDVWAEYAVAATIVHEKVNRKQAEYDSQPHVRKKRYAAYKDYYTATAEKQRARVKRWRSENPEKLKEQKRNWAASKRASDPAYVAKERARHAEYAAKKRTERLAAAQKIQEIQQ